MRRASQRTWSEDSDDGLDRLSSAELHDLAIAYARKHHDVRLLVRLMETLPVAEAEAEAAAGEVRNMEADVMEIGADIDDVTESGRGRLDAAAVLPRLSQAPRDHRAVSARQAAS